jgi:type II secretory pathway pseudopilin PulG
MVELLVVIAIMSLLFTMVLAASVGFQKKAYDILAEGDARSVYIAAQTYFSVHPKMSISSPKTLTEYGLIQTSEVNITVKGTAETLSILAYHSSGTRTFFVNSKGQISW